MTGLRLGMIGLCRLDVALARIGHLVVGMRITCCIENLTQERADIVSEKASLPPETSRAVGKAELFAVADFASLHYVPGEHSRAIVRPRESESAKASALLVSMARAPLICHTPLVYRYPREGEAGGIRGAAMSVFDIEPLPFDSPWRRQSYVLRVVWPIQCLDNTTYGLR